MTREEVIKELQESHDMMRSYNIDSSESRLMTALNMAIKALEQEPCEDAIDKAEAIKIASGYCHPANVAKELAKLPAVNPQPCEDAISRQAVLDMAEDITDQFGNKHRVVTEGLISMLPPVTPQPKTGRWIEHPEIETSAPEYLMFYECSECGDRQCFCKSDIHKKRFCGNCGCRMVEPQESDHKCHTCKHYTSGGRDGSCGSYICKNYSGWEDKEQEEC